jgi:hypothetical protein
MSKRHNFTKKQMREMRQRSQDICEAGMGGTEHFYGMATGETCERKAVAFDHVVADALKREKPQSIDEGRHVCGEHHHDKTQKHDMPKIRKAKRTDEALVGIPKRRNSRPIQSRGFGQFKTRVKQLNEDWKS